MLHPSLLLAVRGDIGMRLVVEFRGAAPRTRRGGTQAAAALALPLCPASVGLSSSDQRLRRLSGKLNKTTFIGKVASDVVMIKGKMTSEQASPALDEIVLTGDVRQARSRICNV